MSRLAAAIMTAVLGVSLSACVTGRAPPHTAAAGPQLPGPLVAGWRGEQVCELVSEDDAMRVLRCTFAPGVGHERHYHPAHFGYTLAGGTMRITDANGVREVQTPTGGHWHSAGVAWHEVLNIGDTTTVYLIVEPKRQ